MLNLILRAYLPDMDNRLRAISEIHTEIDRRFAEAGIVIAFPQRDLHIRNLTQLERGVTSLESRVRSPLDCGMRISDCGFMKPC